MTIPKHIIESIDKYVNNKIAPGRFLRSFLENDLKNALLSASPSSKKYLIEIFNYIYDEVPSGCWGSKEVVSNYLKNKKGKNDG